MGGRCISPAMLGLVAALAASGVHAQTLTIEEALRRAEGHPDVRMAEAEVRAAEGEVLGARTLQYNPELGLQGGRQTTTGDEGASGDSGGAYGMSLGQTFELGGKRGRRVDAAEARLQAARARLERTRQIAVARARSAFHLAAVARARVQATAEGETVAAELRNFARERLELGAGTQLEFNVAAAAAGRSRALRLAAERRYREARSELGGAMGAPAGSDPEPHSDAVVPPARPVPDVEQFVRQSLERRGDLNVTRAERRAAEAEVALAKALARPDPTLAGSYEREPSDHTFLVGISIPLPLFNRNQGGQAVAEALRARATVAEETATLAVEREARTAHAAYVSAAEAAVAFDRDVVDKLTENLELARESFRAGKISLLDFNVIRRDLVETRLAYLDALADLAEARRSLDTAAGPGAMEEQR